MSREYKKNSTKPATHFPLFCFVLFAFYKIINIICPVFIWHLSMMFELIETRLYEWNGGKNANNTAREKKQRQMDVCSDNVFLFVWKKFEKKKSVAPWLGFFFVLFCCWFSLYFTLFLVPSPSLRLYCWCLLLLWLLFYDRQTRFAQL